MCAFGTQLGYHLTHTPKYISGARQWEWITSFLEFREVKPPFSHYCCLKTLLQGLGKGIRKAFPCSKRWTLSRVGRFEDCRKYLHNCKVGGLAASCLISQHTQQSAPTQFRMRNIFQDCTAASQTL